jgi:hypothetical protein
MCKFGVLHRGEKANGVAAEEIQNASTVVPWVMISSIMLDGILGFALLVRL